MNVFCEFLAEKKIPSLAFMKTPATDVVADMIDYGAMGLSIGGKISIGHRAL